MVRSGGVELSSRDYFYVKCEAFEEVAVVSQRQ